MNLKMHLVDVVTAYLYGSLDTFMNVLDSKSNLNLYNVKLQRLLYGRKESSRIWFNRLSDFLLRKGYIKND